MNAMRQLVFEDSTVRGRLRFAKSWVKAWPHCVMCYTLLGSGKISAALIHTETVWKLLDEGNVEMRYSISPISLAEREVLLPGAVMSLLISRVVRDIAQEQWDISTTYRDYFKQLVSHAVKPESHV